MQTVQMEDRMTGIFTKLKVWQLSHELTLEIYKITGNFPVAERYGLTAQRDVPPWRCRRISQKAMLEFINENTCNTAV